MDKNKMNQKKNFTMNYVYAALIGLIVIACAITIALVNQDATRTGAEIDDQQVSATVYVLPMNNATIAKDYSGSELQYNSTLKQWEIHKAIDFFSDNLTVMAIASGTVTNIYTNYLEGTVVEITHSDGLVSIYKSLSSSTSVSLGSKVSSGQIIGSASESMAQEISNGPHLHFELKLNNKLVDPNNYLSLGDK